MSLEKTIVTLNAYMRESRTSKIDVRVRLVVTVVYIVAVVSVPMVDPATLIWLLSYPIIMAEALGVGYGRIFLRSLWVLPLVVLVGAFNPWFDREPMYQIGTHSISRGWVSFFCLTLRGLLSMQALLILISACGFRGMCRALSHLGVPDVLVSQLLMLYRFLVVILDEALAMHRARLSRGFGRSSYPLSMWGTFIGQLLMRSFRRAARVNRAMEARGYDGNLLPDDSLPAMGWQSWIYLLGWTAVIVALRFLPLSQLFF